MSGIDTLCNEKRVLFITTKNLDYIRNEQEMSLISGKASSVKIIGSAKSNYFLRLIFVYTNLLFQNMKNIDVVFVGFAPQLIIPFLKFKFRKKTVIMDFFISMYDTLVCDRKKVRKDSFFAGLLHQIDEKTLAYADRVVVDTRAHGDFFCKEFGAKPEKMDVLYLQANKSIYYPREQKKKSMLQDKFIVLYFGSILPLQGVDVVIQAAELLQDYSNIYFYIIGPVNSGLKKMHQDNVEYIDWLSQEKLAEYIAMADLCLAGHFSGEIEKARRTIPGKAYIYDAMEKKILLGENAANHELFEAGNGKYFVQMGNPRALADKIVEIMEEG